MAVDDHTRTLLEQFKAGRIRALARVISQLEDDHRSPGRILPQLPVPAKKPWVIGITGAPGAGKSSVTTALISHVRQMGQTVAVIAIDPSSPFVGGALLGDRIRMRKHNADEGVYIRSLATRGALGGVTRATLHVLKALAAFGFDWIIVETVGVGQSEIDIVSLADSTIVVLVPGLGDDIQMMKAGLMEIGDIILVNKADRDGAQRTCQEVEAFLAHHARHRNVPVLQSVATREEGTDELLHELQRQRAAAETSREYAQRLEERLTEEILTTTEALLRSHLAHHIERRPQLLDALKNGESDSYTTACNLLKEIVRPEPLKEMTCSKK